MIFVTSALGNAGCSAYDAVTLLANNLAKSKMGKLMMGLWQCHKTKSW
jgi:hypothetical protein